MANPRVLILGSGGREHALAWHLKRFNTEVICAPGSDGIAEEGILCKPFKDFESLKNLIRDEKITQIVVGPEKYLAEGVADFLQSEKIPVFGPTKMAAQLESDKAWAKEFCLRHSIPQARVHKIVSATELRPALKNFSAPYVLKASGLAAGKGVWIGDSIDEAETFAQTALKSHTSLVIEEFLVGEELSYFAMVDGDQFLVLGGAQDHKRLLENDLGPNTGGMGAYSPVPILTHELELKIISKILKPTLEGLRKDGIAYTGFIFLGMMIVKGEPLLLEYNCRLGDPETQALMMRLETNLIDLIQSLKLKSPQMPKVSSRVSLNVVVAAKGYPDDPQQGFSLEGINSAPEGCKIFHSGTKKAGASWTASGGRLFSVNTSQKTLFECQQMVYPWIESLPFLKNVTYRSDIAVKAYRHLVSYA